jgi:hypothetical protein
MYNLGENAQPLPELEEIKTEEIESDEVDIFERTKKFQELTKRFDKHRKEYGHLRGNDLRYNIYMKKIQKLTRKDLGLDMEAYKDYINNLRQFAHLNNDFELYAQDYLASDLPEDRMMVLNDMENYKYDPETVHKKARFRYKCEALHNTIRKFRRDVSGFVSKKDHVIVEDFV